MVSALKVFWLKRQHIYLKIEVRNGEGDGREVQKEGIYACLWLIHVEV